jgi:hypothetical protein
MLPATYTSWPPRMALRAVRLPLTIRPVAPSVFSLPIQLSTVRLPSTRIRKTWEYASSRCPSSPVIDLDGSSRSSSVSVALPRQRRTSSSSKRLCCPSLFQLAQSPGSLLLICENLSVSNWVIGWTYRLAYRSAERLYAPIYHAMDRSPSRSSASTGATGNAVV